MRWWYLCFDLRCVGMALGFCIRNCGGDVVGILLLAFGLAVSFVVVLEGLSIGWQIFLEWRLHMWPRPLLVKVFGCWCWWQRCGAADGLCGEG